MNKEAIEAWLRLEAAHLDCLTEEQRDDAETIHQALQTREDRVRVPRGKTCNFSMREAAAKEMGDLLKTEQDHINLNRAVNAALKVMLQAAEENSDEPRRT